MPSREGFPTFIARLAIFSVASPWLLRSPHAQTPGIRQVSEAAETVIPVQTRLRYTTMIVLPDEEEILDTVCGDKDFWVISATHNLAHVQAGKRRRRHQPESGHRERRGVLVAAQRKRRNEHAGSEGLCASRSD